MPRVSAAHHFRGYPPNLDLAQPRRMPLVRRGFNLLAAPLHFGGAAYPLLQPSAPVLARTPPTGREWLHEVKFDGWRAQLHLAGDDFIALSPQSKSCRDQAP